MQLISLAQEREVEEAADIRLEIKEENISVLEDSVSYPGGRNTINVISRTEILNLIRKVQESLQRMTENIGRSMNTGFVAQLLTSPSDKCRIHLGDAATVLFKITQSASVQKGSRSRSDSSELHTMMTEMRTFRQSLTDKGHFGKNKKEKGYKIFLFAIILSLMKENTPIAPTNPKNSLFLEERESEMFRMMVDIIMEKRGIGEEIPLLKSGSENSQA